MKNTSIEWLFNLTNEGYWDSLDDASKQKALKLGMNMHKEEIFDAYDAGVNLEYDLDMPSPKEYYEQTYGGNK